MQFQVKINLNSEYNENTNSNLRLSPILGFQNTFQCTIEGKEATIESIKLSDDLEDRIQRIN
jgi:hypothetical protein